MVIIKLFKFIHMNNASKIENSHKHIGHQIQLLNLSNKKIWLLEKSIRIKLYNLILQDY